MPLSAHVKNIVKVDNCQVIVNAANGIGVMGAGVAGAIALAAGGKSFVRELVRPVAMANGGYKAGDVYVTECGKLADIGFDKIYHAVTMDLPGGFTSYDIVEKCLNSIFNKMKADNYKTVAIPSLGTGIGGLNPLVVSDIFVRTCTRYASVYDISIVDINKDFIDLVSAKIVLKE